MTKQLLAAALAFAAGLSGAAVAQHKHGITSGQKQQPTTTSEKHEPSSTQVAPDTPGKIARTGEELRLPAFCDVTSGSSLDESGR